MGNSDFYKEKEQVASFMKRLYERHLTTASGGNISLRLNDDLFCITPSAIDKGNLKPEQIAIVGFNGKNYTPELPLSIETEMHKKILLARGDRKAVVHAHPTYACAFATASKCSLTTRLTAEAYYILGDITTVPYKLMGTNDLATIVASYIKNYEVLLMENHGAVAVGNDLLRAFDCMELLERAAVMNIIAKNIDGAKELNEEQLDAIIKMR
ncbi:MAG: class II aldolase/adducin family protein [Sphaerochaetaceae bacterium]|nr:class II aldolase/adducin family protein [Sphaerochaetaceae bacterium]